LATNQLRQITTNSSFQKYPSISGSRIVWQDQRNNGFDIYLYDLDTNQESRITSNTRNIEIRPLISGSRIVWDEGPDIFLYDLETRQERKISSGTGDKQYLSFYGSKIIWSDDRNLTGFYNIYLYDLITNQERCLTAEPWNHYDPNIFGNRIVWTEYQNGNEDIYLYQMETGQKTQITRDYNYQFSPIISDQWISWIDTRDSDVLQTIYSVDIPQVAAPPPAPVISGSLRLSNSELGLSLACFDPLYEIIEYQYAIGTEPGGADVCAWTSTGPSVIRTDLNLTVGQTYYLSVKAKNDAGLWSEPACFSGIPEDIPAKIAFVNDGLSMDLQFTAGPDMLSANWAASTGGASGVKNYWYAIGTIPGGTDLVDWTNNGINLSVTRTGLNLIHGGTYYFAVKVENNAGHLSLPAFSDGQTVDLTPPVIMFIMFNISTGKIMPLATDKESGIISYFYAIGIAPSSTNLVDWTDNGNNPSIERRDLVLTPGLAYSCSVKVQNGAGVFSKVVSSTGQIYDPTPPTQISPVNDGPGPDIDFTPYPDRLSANWTPSSDPETGISHYYYCVGTTPGAANIAGWTDNGPNTSVTLTGLHLVNGATYYFSVKAKNGAGIPMESYSEVTTSNGQTVDTTPPLPIATVNDGSEADIQFTSNRSLLVANWTPSADPESEVVKYYYAIGTAPGLTDVKDWTDNGLNTTANTTGLRLTHRVTYYISVKALNGAGLYSNLTSSNGQMVDTTPPFPISVVYDGTVIGADIKFTPLTTQLSANWTPSADNECCIVAYYYAIGTAPGLTDVVGWTNAGLNTTITKTGLNLVKGRTYYFSIKALNVAGSFSTVTSSNGQRVRKNRKT
jgi:beta propeller repeat protein